MYPQQENRNYAQEQTSCVSKAPEGFIIQKCADLHVQISVMHEAVSSIEEVMNRIEGSIPPIPEMMEKSAQPVPQSDPGSIKHRLNNLQQMSEVLNERLLSIRERLDAAL